MGPRNSGKILTLAIALILQKKIFLSQESIEDSLIEIKTTENIVVQEK